MTGTADILGASGPDSIGMAGPIVTAARDGMDE
jgi:hypothetical protein